MKKTYYEVLEVDKNASQEIIEKAYKTLAKKYHPDLQTGAMKISYESKMKEVNEAYNVLSDANKRQQYDESLKTSEISTETYQNVVRENEILRQQLQYQRQVQRPIQQRPTYYNNERPQYVTYKRKIDIKKYFKLIVTIAITIILLVLIAQIPFIKRFLTKIYEENILIKVFVDAIRNTFKDSFI